MRVDFHSVRHFHYYPEWQSAHKVGGRISIGDRLVGKEQEGN